MERIRGYGQVGMLSVHFSQNWVVFYQKRKGGVWRWFWKVHVCKLEGRWLLQSSWVTRSEMESYWWSNSLCISCSGSQISSWQNVRSKARRPTNLSPHPVSLWYSGQYRETSRVFTLVLSQLDTIQWMWNWWFPPLSRTAIFSMCSQMSSLPTVVSVSSNQCNFSRHLIPSPLLGTPDPPWEEVQEFYRFWREFRSWRIYSAFDEYDPSVAFNWKHHH